VLPRRIFGRLSARFRTPVVSLLIIAAIGVAGQLFTVGDATSLINFGAFLAFATANVCVIVLWMRAPERPRAGGGVIGWILVPIAGVVVDLFLLANLSPLALGIGSAWVVLGLVVLAVLTRGFRRPVPSIDLDAAAADTPSGAASAAAAAEPEPLAPRA
jgi:amino acid transporter